jgi:hypothetical protein
MSIPTQPRRSKLLLVAGATIAAVLISTIAVVSVVRARQPDQPAAAPELAGVITIPSSVRASDGERYTVTNHLTREAVVELVGGSGPHQWLLAWAGDEDSNAPDGSTTDPDFLAVIDVTEGSATYGKVVNTVTIDSVTGNEPHHMQYQWRKGHKVYAGGILSDITYIFDVERLPLVRLNGVVPSTATPCSSLPDAYQVLSDGTAYGTYMGGPLVAGPCEYTDGQVREGNGFGGSPGAIVRIAPDGTVLSEAPAASTEDEGPTCGSIPALETPTCANPHGIALREDLDILVTGDFAEARNLIGGLLPDVTIIRDTVRVFDISDRDRPTLMSVSRLPNGHRDGTVPDDLLNERWGPMEVATPHGPDHRGAFVSTLNGVVYYAPDVTAAEPQWRVVYDDYNAFRELFPEDTPTSMIDGGSWIQVSPDNRFLFRIVLGGGAGSPGDISSGMLLTLDVERLLAAGSDVGCGISTAEEAADGGAAADCPHLVSVVPIVDNTSGGPHWAVMDLFELDSAGHYRESEQVQRIATSNYFFAATNYGGDHRVCLFDVSEQGELSLDTSFVDEHEGTPCLDFNRERWPHGATGNARPHGVLFAINDHDVR